MVKKMTIKGIAFLVLMLSTVLVGITTAVTFAGPASTFVVKASNTTPALILSANPTTITAGTATNVVFTVTSNGSVVSGATVTLSGVATGSGTTDASGNTIISVNATGAGTITAIASLTGYTSVSTSIIASQPLLSISANQTTVAAGTATSVVFTVTSNGSVVSGAAVTLSGVATGSGTTDASGNTIISVNATGAGIITATASLTGFTSVSTSIIASQPLLSISANQTTVTVSTPTDVNFTVTNAGAAVSGATVTLSGMATGSGTTDASGNTIISVNATGAGTITATASLTGYTSVDTVLTATLPNTGTGSPVNVTLDSSTISFASVIVAGNTVENIDALGHTLPSSSYTVVGDYLNISTTAVFTTPIIVSVKYNPSLILSAGYSESDVRLYHWNDSTSQWGDVTAAFDPNTHMVTGQVSSLSPFVPGVPLKPAIIIDNPSGTNINTSGTQSVTFEVHSDQIANITWYLDTVLSLNNGTMAANQHSTYTPAPSIGQHNVTVIATNTTTGLSNSASWNWSVYPKTYTAGNRIWDGGRPDLFSLKYTWNPMSFSGFYYDINSDVGSENITMQMTDYNDRTIKAGNIVYDTAPEPVAFGYTDFGNYSVIGFMADKYFAGYTDDTKPPNPTTPVVAKSALASGQLHKVLMDDDTKRTISVGGTLALQDGYVLKAVDIDLNARTMLISLLKDGNEVDPGTPLNAGQTYVYAPSKVGSVSNLPLIMVRFDSVFSGTEVQAAFLRGVFQISSNPTSVKTGDVYNDMKVTTVGQNLIEMSNPNPVSLSRGNTENLMGNMNILVADNDTFRFALSTQPPTGTFEVRSTVYRDSDPNPIDTWTPYNFGMNIGKTSIGFYYDLDDGIGNESLRLLTPLNGSRSISAQNLVYTTTPEEVSFGYSDFGSYQVIGFMADKYFAGYTDNTKPSNPTTTVGAKSALAQGQLHKVLIDDDTKRTISVGGTLALEEGYVLKAVDIDLSARTMLISLLKDGNVVDPGTPLNAGQTYIYAPSKVGTVSNLPIIMVRFDSVFSGTEVQAAFLRGLFQISSNPTTVKTGDTYNDMKVTAVGQDIEMDNNNAISLDNGKVEQLMGNINLNVGDTSATDNALRFYFSVDVTPEMVANQLIINAPAKATAGDSISIAVTAGGNAVSGASISIGSSGIGTTDANGLLNYTLPKTMQGVQNITATMLGYQPATSSINVQQYIEHRLSIDAPATANQFDTITIRATYNGTAVSGVTVGYDNASIGTTDNNGALNYTLQTSGTHTISASKSGYITAVRDINVRAPFSQYQALDINITPGTVFVNDPALIRSNITNVGTKADTLPVELISNGTVVDNRSVSLAPGEIKEINFTRKEALPGNYTIEIMGQKALLVVKEQPINYLLIGVVATIIGLIAIYILTAKGVLGNLRRKFEKKGLGEVKK